MEFERRLDDLLAEVTLREPSYFERFAVAIPDIGETIARLATAATLASIPQADLARAMERGLAYLRDRRVALSDRSGAPDPLGRIFLEGIADAAAVERGLLPLTPNAADERPIADALQSDYDARRTEAGGRYFVRRRGSRPLLLVNACGIPLALWSRFLTDADHDFRIIAVESRGQDALAGGIHSPCDLSSDADDILAVLEAEGAGDVDLLAWCDGGRLAVEVMRRAPGSIRRLALLSASFRGTRALVLEPTTYESNFEKVIGTLTQRPTLAPMFAKMLREQLLSTDWDAFAGDASGRASALLRLPAKRHENAIRVPMSRDVYLLNHAHRIRSDAAYPIDDAVRALSAPVMMIAGDWDHIANNAVARAALSAAPAGGLHAQLSGAGHYCFDLQYPYFKLLLTAFLIDNKRPVSTARLRVEDL